MVALRCLVLCFVVGSAGAERCESAGVVLNCKSRCAGVNATSISSSNPPPEQVFASSSGHGSRAERRALAPQVEIPLQGGSPSDPSEPSDQAFTNQTVYIPIHRPLSPDQLMAAVGPAVEVEWLPIETSMFHCADGRHSASGLYAYGGDLGEFALVLSVLEHMSGRLIGQAETTRLLESWLHALQEKGGKFCNCIDASAVEQLAAAVGQPADLELTNPPEEARPSLMLRLVAPEFVGSAHLKWLLQFSDTYATRRTLVEQLLRSYYGVLWNRYHPLHTTLHLHVMSGARAERAVVHIHASHWCSFERGLAPAVPSKTRAASLLLVHPDAVAARREAVVTHLSQASTLPVDITEFNMRVRTLGQGQADLTEKALAGMLRSYSLLFK